MTDTNDSRIASGTGNGYDVIVIGAGHNGLTAAGLLAKSGKRVLVLECRDVIGGLCAGEEFHPGYRTAGLHHDTSGVRPWVVQELGLTDHGLKVAPDALRVFSPQTDGPGLLMSVDPEVAAEEISAHSSVDAQTYRDYRQFVGKLREIIASVIDDLPPDVDALSVGGFMGVVGQLVSVRKLGKRDMMELVRVPPMCVADWLNEWFETELIKCSLAGPALYGNWVGPWSPGTAANLLFWDSAVGHPISGGPAALIAALETSVNQLGGEIRTNSAVQRINVEKGVVSGVTLASGETIAAPTVLSSCDPKTTFFELLEPNVVPHKLQERIRHYRTRGTTAKVNLALNQPLTFACRPGEIFEYARTAEHLDDMERAFDPVKYRDYGTATPLLDIHIPTTSDPSLAPEGHAVASILVHFAPYDRDGGWTEERRTQLGSQVVSTLSKYVPGLADSIVAREVLTPLDIEERYGVTGGHIFHGEHGLDQLAARPTPETSRFATPIPGLYLCGGGSHPGGGVTCAPGGLAAKSLLEN